MEIYFDWELDETIEKPVRKWVYEDLRTFLRTRYRLLEEEIDRRKEGEVALIAIIWNDDGSIQTKYFFIPKDLQVKLNDSVSQSDMKYIQDVIGRKIDNPNS